MKLENSHKPSSGSNFLSASQEGFPFAFMREDEIIVFLREMQEQGYFVDILLNPFAQVPIDSHNISTEKVGDLLRVFFNLADTASSTVLYYPLFLRTPLSAFASSGPILWRVNSLYDLFLSYLIKLSTSEVFRHTPWGYIMLSTVPFKQNLFHWHSLLEAQLPSGKKTHLRIYDPTIMWGLIAGSDSYEKTRLFGPVNFFMGPPGKYLPICSSEAGQNEPLCNHFVSHWSLAHSPHYDIKNAEALSQRYISTYPQAARQWFYEVPRDIAPPPFNYTDCHKQMFRPIQDKVDQANLITQLWENDPVKTFKFATYCEQQLKLSMEQAIAAQWREAHSLHMVEANSCITFAWLYARHYRHPVFNQGEFRRFFRLGIPEAEALEQLQKYCEKSVEEKTYEH